MRTEAEHMWTEAVNQLRAGVVLFGAHPWSNAASSSELATQQALKAFFIEQMDRPHPRTHDLHELERLTGAPASLHNALRRLNPPYIATRYPDVSRGIPSLLFTRDQAHQAFQDAYEVLTWVSDALKVDWPKVGLD